MSSSDEEVQKKTKKGVKKSEKQDYQIKPSNGGPKLDTSNWPLLLKVKPNSLISNNYRTLIS